VSITKDVVIFTTNPKKLSLHFSEFSTIFYEFYKFQQFANTIGDTFCAKAPGTNWGQAMWPLAMAGGAGGQIPATPARGSAGKVGERG
jgi:hypothetical protein